MKVVEASQLKRGMIITIRAFGRIQKKEVARVTTTFMSFKSYLQVSFVGGDYVRVPRTTVCLVHEEELNDQKQKTI